MPLFYKYILVVFILVGIGLPCEVVSQLTEVQARQMLLEKGIPEDTLRNRLLKKGYDPDRVRPDQLDEFQNVIIETIREIEADMITREAKEISEFIQADTTPPVSKTRRPSPPPVRHDSIISFSIYGQEIFRNNSLAVFQQAEQITPSDSYVLGTGDKIGVVGFGRSQFEQVMDVDPDGFIRPSGGIPKILVKGLTLGEAKELLYKRYNQYYVIGRGEFQVTVNRARNVTVNVFGEARTTGAFTLPGFNTAFNVISAAGGPTDIGSVRRIKVISGAQTRILDVYEFMSDPSVAKNFFLQDNDYIHIPVAEKVVRIQGAINRPMAYELLEKENLAQLIKFAGGIKPTGYLSDVQIVRYLDDRQIVTNVNFKELSESGGDYILFNGDIITIKTIADDAYNFVSVSGAVQFPGRYERREGMRISDLLSQSKLKPEARLDFAYLMIYQPDSTFRYERINLQEIIANPSSIQNIVLDDRDELQVMAYKSYSDITSFSVSGAVRRPSSFSIDQTSSVKLEDAILLAGGLSLDAADHGYVMRQDPSEPKTVEYLHVDLRSAFDNPASAANIEILPGDEIVVYSKANLRDDLRVNIYGAVREPGEYAYGPGMTLADLVNLAGGFSFSADHQRIDIARSELASGQELRITQYTTSLPVDFNVNQTANGSVELKPFDHVYVRSIPEFEMQQTVVLQGEVKYPGTYAILQSKERISDIIARAGGLTDEAFPEGAKMYRTSDSTGLVVINLNEILQNEGVVSNVTLQNGDVIDVPKSRDLVTIGGKVNLDDAYSQKLLNGHYAISVAFRGEKSAKYYIDNFAAGISDEGAPSEVKVQYADGRVEKSKKFLVFNTYPTVKRGSIITVGDKKAEPQVEKEKKEVDWGGVLRDTLTQATAVLTLLILVDQLGK